MSNLIITIISIALVAVAVVMGVYYGGAAYQDASAQAAANKMLSDVTQIAAAFQQYVSATGSTDTPTNTGYGDQDFAFLVSQNYLTQQPTIPSGIVLSSDWISWETLTGVSIYNYACMVNKFDYGSTNDAYQCAGGSLLSSWVIPAGQPFPPSQILAEVEMDSNSAFNKSVCQKIATQARGKNAPIENTSYDITMSDAAHLKFDCAAEPASDGNDAYVFAYRLY